MEAYSDRRQRLLAHTGTGGQAARGTQQPNNPTTQQPNNPTPNTQHPTPNTQYPIPNTQYPIPNTQYPTTQQPNNPTTQQPNTQQPNTQQPNNQQPNNQQPNTQYPTPNTQQPNTQYPARTQSFVPFGMQDRLGGFLRGQGIARLFLIGYYVGCRRRSAGWEIRASGVLAGTRDLV